ncbi:hypothetical protein FA531_20350, partial [Pseudomonas aeruginosa]|nr:hypothetical protein [Pseudomonas aeruginosa]
MRRAEMLLLKSLAETLMADRDNRHDDLQATMRLARISHSPAHWAVLTDAGRRRWRRLPTALIS